MYSNKFVSIVYSLRMQYTVMINSSFYLTVMLFLIWC